MGPRASRPPGLVWPVRSALCCPAPVALPVPFRTLRQLPPAVASAVGSLQDVPDVVLQLIMEWGSVADIAHWASVDKRCLAVVLSEDLWRALCVQWLHIDSFEPLGLCSFCSAFFIHHCHASIVGVWQVIEDYPYGDLLQLAWRHGCLEATSLHSGHSTLFRISFDEENDEDTDQIVMSTHIALHWHPDDAEDDVAGVPWSRATWELQAFRVAGVTRTFMALDWNTSSVDATAGQPLGGPADQLLRQAMQSCSKLCTSLASMTLTKVLLVPESQKCALMQAAISQALPSEVPREQPMPLPLPGLYSGHYGSIYGLRAVEFVNLVYLPLSTGFSWAPSRDLAKVLTSTLEQVCTTPPAAALCPEGCEWWLVALKVTGDEHVPLGEVSFRVKVSGEAPDRGEGGALAMWTGLGQLALPGFKGAYWCSGMFELLPHGECCFAWSAGANFNVRYTPVPLSA